ncbi:hypothetical protein HCC61_00225 [Streptomyces sp. HNM0575]|uniref:hypothetical protein n=1 Tax=Streptomyces sp. HNM0575 TaxID=2716338 RepID=UPI00145D0C25|nr:hypothetical protein [Streptomyces sp. HNM0575]NLU71145.1 hypothetical protein [Streptomyces sp. HNM0575]
MRTETLETRGRLRVGWIMPPFFLDLPVQATDADDVARRVHSLATEILADRSTEEQYRFARMLLGETGQLMDAQAEYAGLCFLDQDGRTSMATVIANRIPQESGTPEEICALTVTTLRGTYPEDDVQAVQLPKGDAAIRVGSSPFLLPADAAPDGQSHVIPRNLIQAYVPLPGEPEMLVFEMSTTSLEDWDLYSEMFAEILKTLDWTTDQEVEKAATLAQQSSFQRAGNEGHDESARRQLTRISARLLDTLAVANGLSGLAPEAERLSDTTCSNCSAKGHRSPCETTHEWQVSGEAEEDLATSLAETASRFAELGWQVEELGAPTVLTLGKGTHRIVVSTALNTDNGLHAEVTALCTRMSSTAVADDFG